MKKLILLLILLESFAFSAIDECKTDVYFGNGILTKEQDAINNADLLEKSIKKERYSNNEDEMYKYIGKVDYAYNRTVSQEWDFSFPSSRWECIHHSNKPKPAIIHTWEEVVTRYMSQHIRTL